MHKQLKSLFFLFLICLTQHAFSQSCTLSAQLGPGNTTCVNQPVQFTATNTPIGNVLSYNIFYGDGFSSGNQPSPVVSYPYSTPGTYQSKLIVNLIGGITCEVNGPKVIVNPLPKVSYVILSSDTVCFKNNQICIQDLSTPGSVSAAIVKRTYQLNDGFVQTENAPYSNIICYTVTNQVLGFLYTFNMEITDANGCVNTLEKKDSLYLAPETYPPSFRFSDSLHCTNTLATFINTSPRPQSDYRSFKWDFGDGQSNTTKWTNVKHTYIAPGGKPNLYTTDIYGCKDTALTNPADTVLFIVVDDSLRLTTNTTQCFNGNQTRFRNQSKNYTSKLFTFYDANNKIYAQFPGDSAMSFLNCGVYRLNLKVTFPDPLCNINKDVFIHINGPNAIIHNDTIRPYNATQCEAHDTIYIITPNPYVSCHSGNSGMKWFWDFEDGFAPACTTDTKHNVNVGVNCRYSVDSVGIKHYYSKDGCYGTKLVMTDTIVGCSDADSVVFALTAPDAGWDSTSNPIRRGLYNSQPQRYICPNTTVEFYFNELLPACGYEKLWLNYDSACGKNNWTRMDTLHPPPSVIHTYSFACDSTSGWITVGIIVKNGLDKNGKECYDTAWYHNMLHLDILKSDFHFTVRPRINCGPYVVDFQLNDTNQKNLEYAFWDFDIYNSSSVDDTVYQYLLNGDSIVKRQTWTYPTSGFFTPFVALKSKHAEAPGMNCFSSFRQDLILGIAADAGAFSQDHCINDTFRLYGLVHYQNSSKDFWGDSARAAANKEKMWWDIGDGKGFFYTGPQPLISYKKPGTYNVRMVTQDSLGCKDTFTLFGTNLIPLNITVSQLKAKIATTQLVYYCQPQIVTFQDSTLFVDSNGAYITPDPFLVDTTYWTFDDGKSPSYFKNPAHNFTANGIFNIKLVSVASAVGCRDTATVQIEIKGPNPQFVILSDTQGCQPFKVVFHNTTPTKISSWVWYLGDKNGTAIPDVTGGDITFTYPDSGTFKVHLLGIDQVFNPSTGNSKTCSAYFPDTITNFPERTIYVSATAKIDLVPLDTICPNVEATFKLLSDARYKSFHWDFGDGDSTNINRPDTSVTHTYTSTGLYKLVVIPSTGTNLKCIDTVTQTLHVQSVKVDFDIDDKKSPLFSFTNKSSSNAVKFEWNFGQPSSSTNTSAAKDPQHNFGAELGEFIVCLKAISKDDCEDTICKSIKRDTAYIKIPNVFTPDNNDGLNDAFDIDIQGYTQYYLLIYNRWGGKVFEGKKDGVGNDGDNWNGKEDNEGIVCPSGVYYFIFTYKLITENSPKTVHGTVTLLRDPR